MTTIAELTHEDRCIAAALERLANDARRESADPAVVDAAERKHFTRWANAYRKALLYFMQGIRPEPTISGGWLVPSATRSGVVHYVAKDGGCSCEAGSTGCWHAGMALGTEIVAVPQLVADEPPPPADEDRARSFAEMDELFA